MRFFPRLFLFVCALFVVVGCGKKDHLYLPDDPAKLQPAQPANK